MENIFNILKHSNLINIRIENSNILDLYSGIGSFGLEGLSRGAKRAIFIEQNKDALTVEQISKINVLKEDLLATTQGDSKDVIEASMEAMNLYTAPLAHEALDRNIGKALKETKV